MQNLGRWLLVIVITLSLSACSTVKGWFEFDDDEDPTQPVELIDIEETVKFKKLWSGSVGNGQADAYYKIQPAVNGEALYVASAEGEVKSFNRQSGKTLWKQDLERELSGGVGVFEDTILLGSSDGSVISLTASAGSTQWTTRLSGEILSPPQGDGKTVVAQTYDGKLHGLEFGSGEKIWTYDSNVPVLTIRGASTPILRNGIVYAGFANGRVLAFTAATGAIVWEARVAISQGRSEIERIVDVDGSMALVGNELYAASFQGRVVAIDVTNGRKIWQNNVSSFSGVSQGFGNVYVTDEDGTVYAYLRNGQGLRWEQGALGYRELSRPTPVNSYLAVADLKGYVHLMSQVDGEFVGREKVDGNGARADMYADGNVLYVYGNSGKIVAYEIQPKD